MRIIRDVKKIGVLLFVLVVPFMFSCSHQQEITSLQSKTRVRDLSEIRKIGKLRVVTDFNSINYFIYRGQPMGFQYELLQELSDYLGIPLEVKVNNDLKKNFEELENGDIDLIASNLTVTGERKEMVDFTLPNSQTRQVLVQRKDADDNEFFQPAEPVRNPLQLGGKTIYVQKNSVYAGRLHHLSEETGEKVNIVEVPIEAEQLIRMVARKEIDYTVADENIAKVNSSYYDDLDIGTVISFPQNQAWAVRKGAVELKNDINDWLEGFKKTRQYALLYQKYFNSSRSASIVTSEYYYPETGRISRYDNILKKEGEKIGWDWRLLASMIYQESRFNPQARSWAGAFGVMQLMPLTAKRFGVDANSSAVAQIRAGVSFIHWLDVQLTKYVPNKKEREKFVLASYNIGLGHVLDAINLTKKYGKDPAKWQDNVEYFLLKKSDPKYFTDPVVKNGYVRGTETYRYVRDIMYRYNHYLNINDSDELAQLVK